MTKQDRDKLRTLALAATPGEWGLVKGSFLYQTDIKAGADTLLTVYGENGENAANAAYIAAANPATLLALLDRIDELEGDAEPVGHVFHDFSGNPYFVDPADPEYGEGFDVYLHPPTERAVPEGWQLVPVEPTPEMLNATSWPNCARTDYKHMLAAAPGAGGES